MLFPLYVVGLPCVVPKQDSKSSDGYMIPKPHPYRNDTTQLDW
jgi:hypothetical protein